MLAVYGIGGPTNNKLVGQVPSMEGLQLLTRGMLADARVFGVSLHGTLTEKPDDVLSGEMTMTALVDFVGLPSLFCKDCGCSWKRGPTDTGNLCPVCAFTAVAPKTA